MKTSTNPISRARAWLRRNPAVGYSIVAAGVLVFGGISYAMVDILSLKPTTAADIPIKPRPPEVHYSPLTGEKVKNRAATKKPVYAIIVENSPNARPQSGLKDAEMIYEAVAEGGITRFMVLYQQRSPSLIGPVRSVRHYHLDLVKPYQASLAHVGGSPTALRQVRAGGWRDLEQMYNSGGYWRAADRYAPHNVYTNGNKLAALNKQKRYTSSNAVGFTRKSVKAPEKPNARQITINLSSSLYNSTYTYDAKKQLYTRYQGGEVHRDRERGAITARVIVAMRVNERNNSAGEKVTTTIGSGKATVFQKGQATNVTWRRSSSNQQLKFYLKNGKEFSLDRGNTWVSLVPNSTGSVSWK